MKRAERAVRVLQPGARAPNGIRNGRHRFVLPDNAIVQALFHADELLRLRLPSSGSPGCQSSGRRPRPMSSSDTSSLSSWPAPASRGFGFELHQAALQLAELRVAQARSCLVVGAAFGLLDLHMRPLDLLLELPHALDAVLLLAPLGAEAGLLLLERGEFALEPLEALLARPRRLPCAAPRARLRAAGCAARPRPAPPGRLSISVRRRAAASSTRSIALSGRKRSVM